MPKKFTNWEPKPLKTQEFALQSYQILNLFLFIYICLPPPPMEKFKVQKGLELAKTWKCELGGFPT